MNIQETAKAIAAKFENDAEFRAKVLESPEFYRACVYESKLVENVEEFDGTEEYSALVDELWKELV